MLQIKGATEKLQLVSSAAGNLDVSVDFAIWDLTTGLPPVDSVGDQVTNITTAATTDILAVAGANLARRVKRLAAKNKHATVSNSVTLQRVTAGPVTTEDMGPWTLLPKEALVINEAGTPFVYTANGEVKAAGSSAGVDPRTNDFRLSGVSATPVMIADSTTLSTIFLAQWKGNRLALWDGANWQLCQPSSEVSLAVTGRTTDLPFDIFAFLSAGVVTLEFLNWTSATARATTLTRQDGVWTKTGDATRRYLGSCRARSATTFHWVRSGDDLPVKLDLWNVDNRVEASFTLRALTNTWAYTVATWRQAQASVNYQVDVMVGLQEETMTAQLTATSTNATTTVPREVGIGFDSTTAFTGLAGSSTNEAAVASQQLAVAHIKHQPTIGRHFYAWLEISTALGTTTWFGDNGALRVQSGMTGSWEC